MDIARPDIKRQKRRKQIIVVAISVVLLGLVTVGVSRLKPAAPEVERGTVWTDTVKRGPMLRQVRGLGSLIPSQEFTRQIPAETEATVVRIHMLPGTQVKADSILLEMSNPQAEQAALDAALQLKAAEAEYQSLRVKLQSDLMNQKASAATVTADYSQAKLQSETDKALYDLGVISGLAYKASKGKSDELTTRNNIEDERLTINQKAIESQMAEQQAKVDEMRVSSPDSGPQHQRRDRQGIGRFVDQGRDEDAETGPHHPLADPEIGRHRTRQGDTSGQGMDGQPECRRTPSQHRRSRR